MRRENLQTRLTESYREVDRLIVSVGSGTLAISVAFLNLDSNPLATWALKLSWVTMFIAVLSVLLSLLFEQADKRRRIKQIDSSQNETDSYLDTLLVGLNAAGVLAFIGGLFSIAFFLLVNAR